MIPLRLCLVASSTYPVREPFAGGMEAATATLARALAQRGHHVSLFAAHGSQVDGVHVLPVARFRSSPAAERDVNARPTRWMAEHHAYLELMLGLARSEGKRFDVVHDNSTHYLPIAMAGVVPAPVVSTLHTPPLAWLESAATLAEGDVGFTAVSAHTRRAWLHAVDSHVVLNGVDVTHWRPGPGGGPVVWTGRLVPEKAPHLAIEACRRAGVPLVLAGPVHDRAYVAAEVTPRLHDRAHYAGHLAHRDLAALVAHARAVVVTPEWDEPYGLVAAEALASGTPVAAFARGGLPEVVAPGVGSLAAAGDVDALAAAVLDASRCDRREARAHAVRHLSLDRMVAEYEDVYVRALDTRSAA